MVKKKMFACLISFFSVETSLHLHSFSLWIHVLHPALQTVIHTHCAVYPPPNKRLPATLAPSSYPPLTPMIEKYMWHFLSFVFLSGPRNRFLPRGHGGPLSTSSSPSDCHCSSFFFQLPWTINCPSVWSNIKSTLKGIPLFLFYGNNLILSKYFFCLCF